MELQKGQEMNDTALARRDFLRKSVYAACATPVIMSLLVEKANAAQSWNAGMGNRSHKGTGNGGPLGGASNSGKEGNPDHTRWEGGQNNK